MTQTTPKYLHANADDLQGLFNSVPSSFTVGSPAYPRRSNFLPDMPVELVSPNAFGSSNRPTFYTLIDGSVKIELLRHSAQTSYINIKFLRTKKITSPTSCLKPPSSVISKTTANEWRLSEFYRMRGKTGRRLYNEYSPSLFDHLNGKYAEQPLYGDLL